VQARLVRDGVRCGAGRFISGAGCFRSIRQWMVRRSVGLMCGASGAAGDHAASRRRSSWGAARRGSRRIAYRHGARVPAYAEWMARNPPRARSAARARADCRRADDRASMRGGASDVVTAGCAKPLGCRHQLSVFVSVDQPPARTSRARAARQNQRPGSVRILSHELARRPDAEHRRLSQALWRRRGRRSTPRPTVILEPDSQRHAAHGQLIDDLLALSRLSGGAEELSASTSPDVATQIAALWSAPRPNGPSR